MTYGKSSRRHSTIYTKAADLKHLEKELENLRNKRMSRRHFQHLSFLPPTKNDKTQTSPEGKESQNQAPTLEQPTHKKIASLKGNKHDNQREVTMNQTEQKYLSPKSTTDLSTGISICRKQVSHADDLAKGEVTSSTDHLLYAHKHSLLLKNLNLPTKAAHRKLNRQKSSAKPENLYSDEDDLTAELLRTAFQNLESQPAPDRKSKYLNTDTLFSENLKSTFSSPGKKSTRKKQSSLSKLRTAKGKVSTAINVFENGPSATSHHHNKTNNPRQSLVKSVSPSWYYQQLSENDASLPSNTAMVTQSLSILSVNQLQPQSQSPQSTQHGGTEISQLGPPPTFTTNPHKHLTLAPANSKQPSLYTTGDDKRRHGHTYQNCAQRPLSVYTPQLSRLDCESHHDLSRLCPLPELLFEYESTTHETSSSSQSLNTEHMPDSTPPTPPLDYSRTFKFQSSRQPQNPSSHQLQKDIDTDQLDALSDTGDITTSKSNSQLIYDTDSCKIDSIPPIEANDTRHINNTDHPQIPQQQYTGSQMELSDDTTSDSDLSDGTDADDMDGNDKNDSSMTLGQPLISQRKQYSDGSYFDHCYDYHINTATAALENTYTASTAPHALEQQRKVPPPSLVASSSAQKPTTSSSPFTTTPTTKTSVTSTRGFWDVFSTVMGQQQRSDAIPLDQSGATQGQQGVKYLPTSWSQHQYNNISTTTSTTNRILQPSSTNWPSRSLSRRQKSLGKSARDHRSSSFGRKGNINKKPEPAYHAAIPPGKESIHIFTTPTNHSIKIRTKKFVGYRASSSLTKRMIKAAPMAPAATAQPKWRQPLHVSKHYS